MRCARSKILWLCMGLMLTACSALQGPAVKPEVALEPSSDQAVAARPSLPNPYDASAEPKAPQVRALFDKAIGAIENDDWANAEGLLLEAISIAPQYSGLHYNLGVVYSHQQNDAAAAAQLQLAIEANANNIYAYNALAQLKRKAGEFEQAESLYLRALTVWPDHADSHRNLGILYDLYQGKLGQALAHYREFQALQPQPDRLVNAWIVDIERRLPAPPDQEAAKLKNETAEQENR